MIQSMARPMAGARPRRVGLVDRAPPPRLGRQSDEERRRVDRAVVPAAGGEGAAASVPAQLVQDPARLLLGRRVVLAALEVRQAGQDPSGEGAVEGQGHPGGQQRVATEQRHEPRCPGGHDGAVRVLTVDDAQGGQVGQGLVDRGGQAGVERDHGRYGRAPGLEVPDRHSPGQLGRTLELGGHAGRDGLHGDDDLDLVPSRRCVRRQPAVPRSRSTSSGSGCSTTSVRSWSSCGRAQRPPARRVGLRLGRLLVAGAALDVEDVREVGGDLQLEVHADGQRVRVAQGQLLDQAAREPPAADHQDLRDVAPHGVAARPVPGSSSTAVTTRETTTAENGVGVLAASSSTRPPVTVIRSRLRWRRSS